MDRFKESYGAYKEAMEMTLPDEDEPIMDLNNIVVPVKRGAKLPYRASEGAAGYDMYSPHDATLRAGTITAVPLGLSMKLPHAHFLQLCGRSSLEKKGLLLVGGVVDSDFVGEIHALIFNSTRQDFNISKGQRICQGILLKYTSDKFQHVDQLHSTARGTRCFGSTGNL